MPINVAAFIEILAKLCEDHNIRVAVKESLKGTLITGSATLIGGLILGRAGLIIGGALGTMCSALSCKEFLSAAEILRNMNQGERRILYEKVKTALSDFTFEDAVAFSALLMRNSSVQDIALNIVKDFITHRSSSYLGQ